MARDPRASTQALSPTVSQAMPVHVVQRALPGIVCFFDHQDRLGYLKLLDRAANRHFCRVHAYALLNNQVHLLLSTPLREGISKAVQHLGERYAQRFSRRHNRVAALWEPQLRSRVVGSDDYVLDTYRCVERHPVTAGLCVNPTRYRWSSARFNAWGQGDGIVRPHEVYQRLGPTSTDRQARYRKILGVDA